ncbi:MAG: hypothetical protein JKY54_11010, partial [Flavobacteriales bacterium]|nr:hypothetical protein [Flavobacteriales bacterium]
MECFWGMVFCTFAAAIGCSMYLYAAVKNNHSGSDHFTHQLFINLIRDNRNRFITKRDNILNENVMSYPQLIHWIIAVVGDGFGKYIERFLPLISYLFNGIVAFAIEYSFLPDSHRKYLGVATGIYLLTPFLLNPSNAKNRGLSTRGIGIGLVYCYLLFVILAGGELVSYYT